MAAEYGMDWNDTMLKVSTATGHKSVHFLFDGTIRIEDPLYPDKRWFVRWSPTINRWTLDAVEAP